MQQADLPPSTRSQSIHNATALLTSKTQQIAQLLSSHRDFFARARAYPLPDFPDLAHENVVGQLLRKKLQPGVEDWMDEGRRERADMIARIVKKPSSGDDAAREGGGEADPERKIQGLDELWQEAPRMAAEAFGKMPWGSDYTVADREAGVENVETGLRRKLRVKGDNEEVDEDDEDEEVMDGQYHDRSKDKMDLDSTPVKSSPFDPSLPPLPLETVVRFMNSGVMP